MPFKIVHTGAELLYEKHHMLSQVLPSTEVLQTNITLEQIPFMNLTTCSPRHFPPLKSSLQSSQYSHLLLNLFKWILAEVPVE